MGENIKALRKQLGLSQADFGEKLGVSRDVIANIEYGRVKPKPIFTNHICDVFHVNKDWLLHGNGAPFIPSAEPDDTLNEAMKLFSSLSPSSKVYALQLLRGLLEVQEQKLPTE